MKFNKLIPELSVSNFNKSLNFYAKVLRFKIKYTRKKFAFLEFNKSQIMIQQKNKKWRTSKLEYPFGRGINFQIQVKDIKPILKSLKNNKYKLFKKTEQNWYKKNNKLLGCKEFLVQDPDGYLLRFSQEIGKRKIK